MLENAFLIYEFAGNKTHIIIKWVMKMKSKSERKRGLSWWKQKTKKQKNKRTRKEQTKSRAQFSVKNCCCFTDWKAIKRNAHKQLALFQSQSCIAIIRLLVTICDHLLAFTILMCFTSGISKWVSVVLSSATVASAAAGAVLRFIHSFHPCVQFWDDLYIFCS